MRCRTLLPMVVPVQEPHRPPAFARLQFSSRDESSSDDFESITCVAGREQRALQKDDFEYFLLHIVWNHRDGRLRQVAPELQDVKVEEQCSRSFDGAEGVGVGKAKVAAAKVVELGTVNQL